MENGTGFILRSPEGLYLGHREWESVPLGEALVHERIRPAEPPRTHQPVDARLVNGKIVDWKAYGAEYN